MSERQTRKKDRTAIRRDPVHTSVQHPILWMPLLIQTLTPDPQRETKSIPALEVCQYPHKSLSSYFRISLIHYLEYEG
jgi:hypothetical protein